MKIWNSSFGQLYVRGSVLLESNMTAGVWYPASKKKRGLTFFMHSVYIRRHYMMKWMQWLEYWDTFKNLWRHTWIFLISQNESTSCRSCASQPYCPQRTLLVCEGVWGTPVCMCKHTRTVQNRKRAGWSVGRNWTQARRERSCTLKCFWVWRHSRAESGRPAVNQSARLPSASALWKTL